MRKEERFTLDAHKYLQIGDKEKLTILFFLYVTRLANGLI